MSDRGESNIKLAWLKVVVQSLQNQLCEKGSQKPVSAPFFWHTALRGLNQFGTVCFQCWKLGNYQALYIYSVITLFNESANSVFNTADFVIFTFIITFMQLRSILIVTCHNVLNNKIFNNQKCKYTYWGESR